jgi:hypothetical protein
MYKDFKIFILDLLDYLGYIIIWVLLETFMNHVFGWDYHDTSTIYGYMGMVLWIKVCAIQRQLNNKG